MTTSIPSDPWAEFIKWADAADSLAERMGHRSPGWTVLNARAGASAPAHSYLSVDVHAMAQDILRAEAAHVIGAGC